MTQSGPLIHSGTLSGLRALGSGGANAIDVHSQITRDLRATLGDAYAALFAEPSIDGLRVDWFAATPQRGAETGRLSDATEERRNAGEQRLREIARAVLARGETLGRSDQPAQRILGEMMRNALEIPDESAIWLVGDQPVLTFWGFVKDADRTPPGLVAGIIRRRDAMAPSPAEPAFAAAGAARARPSITGRRVASALLAVMAIVFVAATGLALLRACAIGFPASLTGWIVDYCPISADDRIKDDILDERARQLALQEQLNALTVKVALDEQARELRRIAEAQPRVSDLVGCWRRRDEMVVTTQPRVTAVQHFCIDPSGAGWRGVEHSDGQGCVGPARATFPARDRLGLALAAAPCRRNSQTEAGLNADCRGERDRLTCSLPPRPGSAGQATLEFQRIQPGRLPSVATSAAEPPAGLALAGCWRTDIVNVAGAGSPRRYETFCIDPQGAGSVSFLYSDAKHCQAGIKGSFPSAGDIELAYPKIVCSNGEFIDALTQNCRSVGPDRLDCAWKRPDGNGKDQFMRVTQQTTPPAFPGASAAATLTAFAGCWRLGVFKFGDPGDEADADSVICIDPAGAGWRFTIIANGKSCAGGLTAGLEPDGKLLVNLAEAPCNDGATLRAYERRCSAPVGTRLNCDYTTAVGKGSDSYSRIVAGQLPQQFPLARSAAPPASDIVGCWTTGRTTIPHRPGVEGEVLICFDLAGGGVRLSLQSDGTSCSGAITARFDGGEAALTVAPAACGDAITLVGWVYKCKAAGRDELACDAREETGSTSSKFVFNRVKGGAVPKPFAAPRQGRSPIHSSPAQPFGQPPAKVDL